MVGQISSLADWHTYGSVHDFPWTVVDWVSPEGFNIFLVTFCGKGKQQTFEIFLGRNIIDLLMAIESSYRDHTFRPEEGFLASNILLHHASDQHWHVRNDE